MGLGYLAPIAGQSCYLKVICSITYKMFINKAMERCIFVLQKINILQKYTVKMWVIEILTMTVEKKYIFKNAVKLVDTPVSVF